MRIKRRKWRYRVTVKRATIVIPSSECMCGEGELRSERGTEQETMPGWYLRIPAIIAICSSVFFICVVAITLSQLPTVKASKTFLEWERIFLESHFLPPLVDDEFQKWSIALNENMQQDIGLSPSITPVAATLLLLYVFTFGYRAIWLRRHLKSEQHRIVYDVNAFAPERMILLGAVILLLVVAIALLMGWLLSPVFYTISSDGPLKWAISLICTLPLLKAWVDGSGVLRVKDEQAEILTRWPARF